jgi:hypothetical protein
MEIEMEMIACANCGVIFAITAVHDRRLRHSHGSFYCPSGHTQNYPQQTEEERLRKELIRARDEKRELQAKLDAELKAKKPARSRKTKGKQA